MTKQQFGKKAEELFGHNPGLNDVYLTADGQGFSQEEDAKLHAKSLDDKKVYPFQKQALAQEAVQVKEMAEAEGAKAEIEAAKKRNQEQENEILAQNKTALESAAPAADEVVANEAKAESKSNAKKK